MVDEAVALFWRVRYVADQIHTTGGRSETARGVLRGLVRYGARTVPQLAFARSVTRQHTQEVVDTLLADGFVRRVPNPAHVRSWLITPTARGVAAVAALDAADDHTMAVIGKQLRATKSDVAATVRVLREMRELFEASSWP